MTLKKWSVSFEDFSQSWFLCLHPCVHVHHQLVPRIGHGRKCLHTVEHLGWNLIRKRNLVKDLRLEPFWNPTRVESCAPPSSPSACSHWYRELAWHIAMYIATWSSLIIWDDWASPDRTVIILAVKDEEVDHEHVDGEVGEDVALVAVHQLQQLAPGLVRAGQVLQHRLTCHPFYISVPLLTRHLYEFLATSQSGANCSFEEKHNICQVPLVPIELNAFH